jgi:hypothetical protein
MPGGKHTFERLLGRAYNLGCSAYNLTLFGLYDEALSLIRSLGEIANLVMLSALDGPKITEWLHATRKNVWKILAPSRSAGCFKLREWSHVLPASGIEKCRRATHITPDTRPNFHGGSPFVGGRYEKEGVTKCFGALLYVSVTLAMFVARFFKFDDLFEEISKKLRLSEEREDRGAVAGGTPATSEPGA